MFKKVLIANRGEIACRIARTCRRMGIAIAGVHSAADADSVHVRAIGESIAIGGPTAADSYLRIDAVIAAAIATGADAIHPGFGFLAENALFARAVEAAGLAFIGPRPETIEQLGDKAAAKQQAAAAQVPIIPGTLEPSSDPDEIGRAIRALDLPVMLKAAAGGGGKGMRAISSLEGLTDEIESAMREARNAFGDPGLIVETLIAHGRHIEVQIVGDGNGDVLHLFERECSLQRRHQKLIEEAPAANLPSALRDALLADAVNLGKRLRYRGVGTVEFIVSGGRHYFLEVNPRLQVEHPVTEMITGIDIVETMIRIAAGEGLPFPQSDVACRGHAVEARICAEDPNERFLPSTGPISFACFPYDNVRVESGIESGSVVTPYYDSMLAKLICHAPTRQQALDRLEDALAETAISGVVTNLQFLQRLLELNETRTATFHTRLIDESIDRLIDRRDDVDIDMVAIAAGFWLQQQRSVSGGPWTFRAMTGWQMSAGGEEMSPMPLLHIDCDGRSAEIRFAQVRACGSMVIGVNGETILLKLTPLADGRFAAALNDRVETVSIDQCDSTIIVRSARRACSMTTIPYLGFISAKADVDETNLRAPMTGVVTKVNVGAGDRVKSGDTAVVMESMKMELRISSKVEGIVQAIHVKPGDTVERNTIVASIEPVVAQQ